MRQPASVRQLIDWLFTGNSRDRRREMIGQCTREEVLDLYRYVTPNQFRALPMWNGRWINDREVVAAHRKAHKRMERATVREQRLRDPDYRARQEAKRNREVRQEPASSATSAEGAPSPGFDNGAL